MTWRPACERGYNVLTLTNCAAATSGEEQDNAIARDYPIFSHPVSSMEFLASLEGAAELAGTNRSYTT